MTTEICLVGLIVRDAADHCVGVVLKNTSLEEMRGDATEMFMETNADIVYAFSREIDMEEIKPVVHDMFFAEGPKMSDHFADFLLHTFVGVRSQTEIPEA